VPNDWVYKTCPQCRERKRLKQAKIQDIKVFEQNDETYDFGIPESSIDCFAFRNMTKGIIGKVRGFYSLHHQNCRTCQEFLARYNKMFLLIRGFDLWHGHEQDNESTDEEKMLNDMLKGELTE
jgi:hypothetical protein